MREKVKNIVKIKDRNGKISVFYDVKVELITSFGILTVRTNKDILHTFILQNLISYTIEEVRDEPSYASYEDKEVRNNDSTV